MSKPKPFSTRSSGCRDACTRVHEYPLIAPSDVQPTHPHLEVIGVLNPTFLNISGKRSLIFRVDERPKEASDKTTLRLAFVDTLKGRVDVFPIEHSESNSGSLDPILSEHFRQALVSQGGPEFLLSYISHLRVAELHGPSVAKISETPLCFPSDDFSQYGCEDPRATELEGQPVFTYTAVSRFGATTRFASIDTQGRVERQMMLLGPDHKHSAVFPEKIGNYYYMLTRPRARTYVHAVGVWLVRSPDLIHWGNPSPVLLPRQGHWDSVRVGPGTSPIRTPVGWLFFYYGVDSEASYHMGVVVLDVWNPTKVVARSLGPVLSPVTDWERAGRRADTVFACGAELVDDNRIIRLYYGAADTCIGVSEITMTTLEAMLLRE